MIDKSASRQLYEVSKSPDKSFKLYPGMWHGLLFGEPTNNIDIVFADIIDINAVNWNLQYHPSTLLAWFKGSISSCRNLAEKLFEPSIISSFVLRLRESNGHSRFSRT